MFYVFHGEDEYSLREKLDEMKSRLGDESTADLNTTVLDGRSLSLDELRTTCDTLPFLSNQRLVIVEGLLARFEPRSGAVESSKQRSDPTEAGLRAYLPAMPETAMLVFVDRLALSERNPLLKMAKELGGKIHEFKPISGDQLTAWIGECVRDRGGKISQGAAETLGAFAGSNLRQLAQEVDKLLAYTAGRQIQESDVRLLVADASEIKVWALTDALAARQRDQALGVLHQLLDDGAQPPVLMAMIARQFRSLMQVKELDDARQSPDDIARQLHIHSFVARKAAWTARSFTFDRLDAIYRRLLETDLAVKTGRIAPDLALDLLVVELTASVNAPR